jgi:hypothetical protein
VTEEVGSEGGSFADPTHQVATFTGDVRRETGEGTSAAVRDDAAYTLRGESAQDDWGGGLARYATEPSAKEAGGSMARGASTRNSFLFGLAAGALAAAVFRRRR